jgi:hypothetical protein
MDHRGQGQSGLASPSGPSFTRGGKKNDGELLKELERLIGLCQSATRQHRCWQRMRHHLLSQLVCLGRHTLTGVTATAGAAFRDWSAQYRLYSQARFDPEAVFGVVRQQLQQELSSEEPLVVAMDDSLLRKTGPHIPGVFWRRDPLGPHFQVNFIKAQRILQLSAALPSPQNASARLVPIDFQHVPTPRKPKRGAPSAEWRQYGRDCRQQSLTRRASQRVVALRQQLDADGHSQRPLSLVVDGRFTNRTLMKSIPHETVITGRIRSDAKLYFLPQAQPGGAGRRRIYGPLAPTPEQLRQDESVPWRKVRAFATGRSHDFRVKLLRPLRWRATSHQCEVQVVVIAPLGYRLRKDSKVLYRKPAYLVCTDATLAIEPLLQHYLWRWDIEVNFRDEKTLLGVGQAQVRHPASAESVPALAVAAYALLLLAARRAFPSERMPLTIPLPKWRTRKRSRASTQNLIALLRQQLWADAITSRNFSHFRSTSPSHQKSPKLLPNLKDALFYASN